MKKSIISIHLKQFEARVYSGATQVKAKAIVDAADEGDASLYSVVEYLRNQIADEMQMFSEIDLAYEVLSVPRTERNEKTNMPEVDGQGRPKQAPFTIDEQRKNSKIMAVIDDVIFDHEAQGINRADIDEIEFELVPSLCLYLAERMQERANEFFEAGLHIVNMHDYFVDIEADAQKILKKSDSEDDSL